MTEVYFAMTALIFILQQDKKKGEGRGLLRREEGKIKLKVDIRAIRGAIIIKSCSRRFPWLLHSGKMTKQRAGEGSRGGRIYTEITESGGLGVAMINSTQEAKVGPICRALFRFAAFWVVLPTYSEGK